MSVTASAWLLIAWIVAFAALLVVHAIVLAQVWFHARKLDPRWRMAAFFPPLAPFAAWLDGRRLMPLVWLGLVLLYAGLRLVG